MEMVGKIKFNGTSQIPTKSRNMKPCVECTQFNAQFYHCVHMLHVLRAFTYQ
jgi:hypothetical protein